MTTAAITQGIFNLLSGSTALTSKISVYEGAPAVFMFQAAPEDAEPPYVQSRGATDFPEPLDLNGDLREFTFTVEAYADASGDPIPIDDIGDVIADLFRVPTALAIAGQRIVHTVVSGPVEIETDPDTYGRSVSVRCMIYPN